VENEYLISARSSVLGSGSRFVDTILDEALLECARSLVDTLVLERLQAEVNENFINTIAIKASPDTRNPARDLMPSISGSLKRLEIIKEKYSDSFLDMRQSEIKSLLETSLINGEWRREFPGRLILKRFVGRYVPGVSYEAFRNIIIDKMVDAGYQPSGMNEVITKIN
jgi:hypothetical protein